MVYLWPCNQLPKAASACKTDDRLCTNCLAELLSLGLCSSVSSSIVAGKIRTQQCVIELHNYRIQSHWSFAGGNLVLQGRVGLGYLLQHGSQGSAEPKLYCVLVSCRQAI